MPQMRACGTASVETLRALPSKRAAGEGFDRARLADIGYKGAADSERWYAIQCLPHRENAAASHLENQNFHIFLPRRQKTRRHARKLDTVRVPFFPGYLFVRLDLARTPWRCINGTYGVARIVMQGDRPAPAPAGIIEALMDFCDTEGILHHGLELKAGQPVRIMSGAFAEFIGVLEGLVDVARVRVLLDIMGGKIPIVVARECVVPASASL